MIHRQTAKALNERAAGTIQFLERWANQLETELNKHGTREKHPVFKRTVYPPPTIPVSSKEVLQTVQEMYAVADRLRKFTSPVFK